VKLQTGITADTDTQTDKQTNKRRGCVLTAPHPRPTPREVVSCLSASSMAKSGEYGFIQGGSSWETVSF
jgi:hypothetical protein